MIFDTTQHLVFEKTVTKPVKTEYLLTLPPGYDEQPEQYWPLLLTLHGSVGVTKKLEEFAVDLDIARVKEVQPDIELPFVILSPRCYGDEFWDPTTIHALLDEIEEQYRIDADRIYVTGFSNGGNGTWRMAYARPDRFAALAPLAGWGIPFEAVCIAHIPAWIFHGGYDKAVPVQEAEAMAEALRKHGADVTLTIYPKKGHPILRETYSNPELYRWFLKHTRKRAKK